MRLRRRILVGHEHDAVRRRKVDVSGVRAGDERGEDTGGRIDLAERLLASERHVVVVGVQPGRIEGIDLVGLGIGQIERSCRGAGLDHIVEAGAAGGHALDRRKGNRLVGRSRIVHVDDGTVGTAGQDQIAVRRQLHRVGIGQRYGFDLAGHGVEAGRAVGQDRRRQQRATRVIAVEELYQDRIAGAVRISVAQKHLVAFEHDIVVAIGGGRIDEAEGAGDFVGHGIDQRNRRIAVLVL